jgi:DNA-binding MarR family transcriptional regulator
MSATERDLIPEEADVLARLGDLPVDLMAMTVVANVWRAAQEARGYLEREVLRDQGLTWTGFAVLFDLWVWGPASTDGAVPPAGRETREIAASVGVAKSTLTGVLDTLERRELVARRWDEADRRLCRVQLTTAGADAIRALFPRFNEGESALAGGLSDDEKDTLAKLLRRVIRAARKDQE